MMGTNQNGKRFYQVKVKGLDVTSLKELGRLMGPLQRQAFRKVYGKILDLTVAEVFTEAVVSLAQYYDQPLRCFTFGDFQMVPTIEEFEEILGCPLGGRKPYLFSGFLPSLSKIAAVIGDSAKELDRMKQIRNGVVGLPRKYLEGKARDMASQEKWGPFADILALLIFGVVLFPNVDGLIYLAAIDAFLAYHHSKESPVVAILADLFDTFHWRCEKNSSRIVCCLPALCVWLISHLFRQDTRHPCPLQSYRSCAEKGRVDWDQHLAGIGGSAINWFPRWKEGKEGILFSCGDYPNVPLIGTRGCINYNPTLAIRQLGYPMRGAPTEESLSPCLVRDLSAQGLKVIHRIHKAWRSPLKKDKELRGIRNGVIGELGKARLAKEKFKSAATHIRKECTELQEENAATAKALKHETKRGRKEEYGREKFRGALWGSNNELKLRREERDRSRVHGMILKEELVACARSKRSLAQHLEATEQSMLAIIGKYKEELNQSMAHEQKLVEDFTQVYAEKEARGRVIDALHQEATMWMDRFALTLNGSQDLPRLLAKAKAMAKVCTAPEEIHGLINYCQHMIDLMAHIIRNHQMVSISEVMLKLQKTIEDKATTTASSTVREAKPVLQPALNPGLDRNTAVFGRRYSPQAYPYGLPPDFTPCATPEDLSEAPTFEGQLPPYEDYPGQDDGEGDTHLGPLLHLKDPSLHELPQPNIVRHIPASPTPVKESVPFAEDKGKIEALEDRQVRICCQYGPKQQQKSPSNGREEKGRRRPRGHHRPNMDESTPKYPKLIPAQSPNFFNPSRELPPNSSKRTTRSRKSADLTHSSSRTPATPGATYKYAQHPKDNFPPIPMAYSELWPSLLENHLVVAIPGKVLQPPYPKWYDPGAKCVYHSGVPGHNIDSCIPFKYKVQHLISAGWLAFQEEGPNVKTNLLASHGGASVNAVEEDGPSRTKRLGDVATSRRFIYQSLQAACMVSRGGDERDECLFHLGESHDMETCPVVEELLQRLMDCRQLEVFIGGKEEPQICMQSEEKKVPLTPKALVICFTRKGTGSTPIYPQAAPKPTPFAYQSDKAVPWKYTPPASSERVAIEVDSLSAKVTNITGLSGVTRSGRVFASPHPTELPFKGKAPMVQEPTNIATPSKEVDPPVARGAEKKEGLQGKTVTLEEAHEFLRLIQQSEFKVVEQLNKTPARISLLELLINSEPHCALLMKVLNDAHPGMGLGKDCLGNADVVDIKGNPYKYGLGNEPGMPGRRNVPSRFRADRVWPGCISQCFTSAGIVSEEEVAAIEEEFPQDPPSFVQPCHPDSQVGNWRVISQSEVYTADSIEMRGTGTREMARKPRQDFSVSKVRFSSLMWLTKAENSEALPLPHVAFLSPSFSIEAPHKAPTFGHHFCSKSRKEGIFGVVKCVATSGTSKFQLERIDGDPVLRETRIWATWEYVSSDGGGQQGMIVMAAQLIHDRVEMECLEGAWETLEGNTRCRFRGTIRFTATSLVHPDEPARTLQRTVEWILPTPTPYRLVEPVQVIEVTSSEEDPEEDLEELPPEPAEMAPRKLASKRSRKDKAAEGTSSAPEYDSHRFRSAEHQQRFEAIKGWSFLRERRVQLRDDEYTDFQEEIGRRRWASLVTPMAKFDPDIVLKFYANAWPTEEGVCDMRSWVRGQWIPFDADAIGQLLGYPLVLEEGQECEYGQRRNWSDGFDEEAIAQLLCIPGQDFARTAAGRRVRIMRTNMTTLTQIWMTLLLSNILPSDHNSDLPLPKCQLVYAILTRMSIHVAQLIADAIYIFAGMTPTRHPLDPDKSNRALGFPALITGLRQSFGVPVTPSKVQGDAPQAADAPPPHKAGLAGLFDTEQYLRHLVLQQAANHRAHSQGFNSFPCPTPDQFRVEVAWPGDWPEAQAGEAPAGAPAEAPDEADEAREDEEMTDLLDFLGGSGTDTTFSLPHVAFLPPSFSIEAPHKASTFGHHFCSKSRKEGIFGVVKCVATSGTSKIQLVLFECCFAWMLWKLERIDGDPVLRETRIWATWEYVSSVGEWYLEICRGGQETLGTSGGVLLPKTKLDQSRPNPGIIVMAAQLIRDRTAFSLPHVAFLPPSFTIEAPHKAPTFGAHFYSKSRKEGIFGVVKCVATSGTSKFQIVMAAQLIRDRVEMECLEGAWETLEGNTRCRFRGTIRFTATSLVHPDEPARTLQRTVEWILPTPTPYRLVEPVQVIEVTSSEEDPEEDLEELPPEPAVDALDFLEGDEDPLLEVDSPEEVMSASEADSTEDSGPREMAISGGSSS
ncbi:hypothetical protein HKD37_07G019400 [Glycine soja]